MAALGAMTASKHLTTGREGIYTAGKPERQQDFAVVSGDTVYRGGLVGADANGKLVPMADAANLYFMGVCLSEVTGNGTTRCSVDTGGALIVLNYTPASVVESMIGNEVFADGDQDCDLVGGVAEMNPIGIIVEAVSATEVRVQLYQPTEAEARKLAIAGIAAIT